MGATMRLVLRMAVLASALAVTLAAPAADAGPDTGAAPVDHLELAAVLTRDGAYDRAATALAKVDASAPDLDLATYHTVRGMLALGEQRLELAVEALAAAVAAGQDDPSIHLHRAQALVGLQRHAEAVAALDAAGDAIDGIGGAWLLRAHAFWNLGAHQRALDTLQAANLRFPANPQFLRRQVFHLIELGLHLRAAELGRAYLARVEGRAEDYVAIGTALRQSGNLDEALTFLESARLRHPHHGLVARALAQAWLQHGSPLAAAGILAQQAAHEPELYPEAAELFRRAGMSTHALALNARIGDQARKLQQRVGILVELRRYGQVTGMEDALLRAGLLADEDVRYALAYAHFHGGNHEAAERHLAALGSPPLLRRANELRRLMHDCADTRWACTRR